MIPSCNHSIKHEDTHLWPYGPSLALFYIQLAKVHFNSAFSVSSHLVSFSTRHPLLSLLSSLPLSVYSHLISVSFSTHLQLPSPLSSSHVYSSISVSSHLVSRLISPLRLRRTTRILAFILLDSDWMPLFF